MALYDAVFEGGGAKGVAFVGALEVLRDKGHKIRRYVGPRRAPSPRRCSRPAMTRPT